MTKATTILAVFFFCLISCNRQKNNNENTFSSKAVDSIPKIKVINFENSKSIIFTSEYFAYRKEEKYFTPDEKTIRKIEEKLPETQKIIDQVWGDSEWQKLLKIDSKHMSNYYKQYVGFINSKNDSIIGIILLNLEDDPHDFKAKLGKELIFGGDGWFNTNTCSIEYSKKTKKFSVDFDLD